MLILKLFLKKMVIIDFLSCVKKPQNLLSVVWYFLSQNELLRRSSIIFYWHVLVGPVEIVRCEFGGLWN